MDAIRQATRRAVENLVRLAIDERVAFVLIAGDVYDGDWPDYNTGLFFARQMAKLRDAGIDVYLISGNHDAESRITKALSLPDNVAMFPTDKPRTVVHDGTCVAIHGQGFARQAVTENLSLGYPSADKGCFNIGLLHTAAGGYEGHQPYAPCTVDDLRNRGYDYWALGHIHLRETLCEDGSFIGFSGNTQGRHIRETGPKGCLLVTVDGGPPQSEFRPLDVFRWARCETDAAGCSTPEDVLDAVAADLRTVAAEADGRPVAVRVEVAGRCDAHDDLIRSGGREGERWIAEVRSAAMRDYGERIWIEKVCLRTTPGGQAEIADGPLSELRQHLAAVRGNDRMLRELAVELADLQKKLPIDVMDPVSKLLEPAATQSSTRSECVFEDVRWLRLMLDEAEATLFGRLASG